MSLLRAVRGIDTASRSSWALVFASGSGHLRPWLLLIALSSAVTCSSSRLAAEDVVETLNEATVLMKHGDKDGAMRKLSDVEEIAAKDPRYTFMVGVVAKLYSEAGLDDKAIRAYEKAIELSPKNAVYHADLAVVYGRKGLLDKAVTESEKSVVLDPSDPLNIHNLAKWYLQQGKIDQAKEMLAKAISVAHAKADTAEAAEAEHELQLIALLEHSQGNGMKEAFRQARQELTPVIETARTKGEMASAHQAEQQLQMLSALEGALTKRSFPKPAPSHPRSQTKAVAKSMSAEAERAHEGAQLATAIVHLKNGNSLEGVITVRSERAVVLDVPGAGRLTLSPDEIASIESNVSAEPVTNATETIGNVVATTPPAGDHLPLRLLRSNHPLHSTLRRSRLSRYRAR